jgi:peptidoglycan-N-acetylglucosamine deacetylase
MASTTFAKFLRPATIALSAPACLVRRRQENDLAARCAASRTLVLSYDDGPGRQLTPRVIDLLAEHDVAATFFVVGAHAAANPEIMDRLVAAGHEIGSHGQQHLNAWDVGPDAAVRDIEAGYQALAHWIPGNAIFRPPYGKLTVATWMALRRRGARLGWWTVDSGDTNPSATSIEQTLGAVRRAGGGVVLMHDFDRLSDRGSMVLRLTEALLRASRAEGWNVRRLSAVI